MVDSLSSLKYRQQNAGAYFNPFASQNYNNQNSFKQSKEDIGISGHNQNPFAQTVNASSASSFGRVRNVNSFNKQDGLVARLDRYDSSTLNHPVQKNAVLGRRLDISA